MPAEVPRLSLCMIVRDEEERLPACLESVRDLVDEMVIVDTGSVDDTCRIAREFGARVLSFPWQEDFALARNRSLEEAQGRWILVLDADDRLPPEEREKIPPLLQDDRCDGYWFRTVSFVGERPGGPSVSSPHLRLFRNLPVHRYRGAIHEHLEGGPSPRWVYREVRILHEGYLTPVVRSRGKVERNLGILRRLAAETPQDAFVRFNLGTEEMRSGNWAAAAEDYRLARELQPGPAAFLPELVKKRAIALMHLNRHDEALAELEQGMAAYPDYTDLPYLQGIFWHRLHRYAEAIASFCCCVEMGEAPGWYATDDGAGSYQAFFALGLLHRDLGNWEEAQDAFLASLAAAPHLAAPLPYLLESLLRTGGPAEAWEYLREHLHWSPRVSALLAQGALEIGAYRLALGFAAGAPAGAPIHLLQGLAHLGLGHLEQAEAAWRRIPPGAAEYGEALRHRILVGWATDPRRAWALIDEQSALRGAGEAESLFRTFTRALLGEPPVPDPSWEEETVLNLIEKGLEMKRPAWVTILQGLLPQTPTAERMLDIASRALAAGMPEVAERWLARVDPRDPSPDRRFLEQGIRLLAMEGSGQLAAASRAYRGQLEEQDGTPALCAGWARVFLAQCLRWAGEAGISEPEPSRTAFALLKGGWPWPDGRPSASA